MEPTVATLALTVPKALILIGVGVAAGVFNGVAGGGTLLTFPTLLALGVPALTANVTSAVGVLPSYLGGIAGFRVEIAGQRSAIRRLLPASLLGGALGAVALLTTPASSFREIVPWLVAFATLLFALQPLLLHALRHVAHDHPTRRLFLQAGTGLTALYGGYFGAGMGIMLLAVFGLALAATMAELGGLRSVISILVNGLAAAIFIFVGHIDWAAAACIATGTLLGGWAGASAARRLPVPALRAVVVIIGTATTITLLVR